jgi:hypothetical protein
VALRVRRQLLWAALSLLLFWPAAVVAVILALVARRRAAQGDSAGAGQSLAYSRVACWVSLAIFVVATIVLIVQGNAKL